MGRVALASLGGLILLAISLAGGCTTEDAVALGWGHFKASLAADSSSDRPGVLWPTNPQFVHVGETVTFDLRVKPALDDYALFDFPDKQLVIDANPVMEGYRVQCTFARATGPRGVTVSATAYRIRGRQDHMQVGGKVESLQSDDPADQKLATARMQIVVYQSKVEFAGVGGGGSKPDWPKTFLRILADDGQRVSGDIYQADPDEEAGQGYRVTGPEASGGYTVRYLPTADQINRGGSTRAELHLTDAAGKAQVITAEFSTP